jgi:3-dehydroquinate dehydratase-1
MNPTSTPTPIPFDIRRANILGCVNSFNHVSLAMQAKLVGQIDGAELRADMPDFVGQNEQTIEFMRSMCQTSSMPILLTVRDPRERGQSNLKRVQREEIFEMLMPYASAVDIEIANLKHMKRILEMAQKAKIPVVGSFHEFERMPDLQWIYNEFVTAKDFGIDIIKTAVRINNLREFQRLQSLFSMFDGDILQAVMAMGPEFGKISRLLFASLGSTFNYCYLGDSAVSGQWSALEMKIRLKELQQAQ